MTISAVVSENVALIRERISHAAQRVSRSGSEITLMAVTKTQPVENIVAAYEAGIRCFGENRVQEFAQKSGHLGQLKDAQFALIGRLQSNKAGKAVELFSSIHSVDSLRLAERISRLAVSSPIPIAIEINTGDLAKAGLSPGSPELEQLLLATERLQGIAIQGLMTIPPFSEDPQGARPYFRRLRQLRDDIARRDMPNVKMALLSMGMSHDFEVGIEEGSTCVRIGTAIFGERS